MAYIGDFRLGKTFDTKFCTVSTTGAPTVLAGTPVISAYVGNDLTQLTAGITLSVDFDGIVGLNNVRVVATGGNGYVTASNYQLVITTGTVGGTSVVGYVVGEFSIEARSALMPTTADLTLDVSAGGEAGVDWANVGGKTTVNALTNTSIITTQQVDVNTIKTNPVVNAGTVTFPTTATLASTTNITAGTVTTATNVTTVNGLAANVITATSINADAITAAKIADNAIDANTFATDAISAGAVSAAAVTKIQAGLATPTNITAGVITTVTNLTNAATAGDFTATMKTSIGTAVAASAVASVTGNVGGNVNGNVVGSVGSVAGNVSGNVVGTVASVVGNVAGNVVGSVGSVVGGVGGNVTGSVGSVVGNVSGNVTGTIGGLTVGALADFFDTDSGKVYADAVAGSVVKETASNATFTGNGSTLTAIPWNPAWDAEVQSEVLDGIRTQLTGTASAPGDIPTLDQIAYMIGQFVQDVGVVGTTKTIYAVDGTTPLFTLTLDNAANPTSTQRAT